MTVNSNIKNELSCTAKSIIWEYIIFPQISFKNYITNKKCLNLGVTSKYFSQHSRQIWYRNKSKTNKDSDGFGIGDADSRHRSKNAEIDMMEGISDLNLLRNDNDSFDSIFNKELDLDIGMPTCLLHF